MKTSHVRYPVPKALPESRRLVLKADGAWWSANRKGGGEFDLLFVPSCGRRTMELFKISDGSVGAIVDGVGYTLPSNFPNRNSFEPGWWVCITPPPESVKHRFEIIPLMRTTAPALTHQGEHAALKAKPKMVLAKTG